jgi:hypothetical protein
VWCTSLSSPSGPPSLRVQNSKEVSSANQICVSSAELDARHLSSCRKHYSKQIEPKACSDVKNYEGDARGESTPNAGVSTSSLYEGEWQGSLTPQTTARPGSAHAGKRAAELENVTIPDSSRELLSGGSWFRNGAPSRPQRAAHSRVITRKTSRVRNPNSPAPPSHPLESITRSGGGSTLLHRFNKCLKARQQTSNPRLAGSHPFRAITAPHCSMNNRKKHDRTIKFTSKKFAPSCDT